MSRLTSARLRRVSIPQSEFCPLGPRPCAAPGRYCRGKFQFLSRNSVRWDLARRGGLLEQQALFQFLSRNSVRWDPILTTLHVLGLSVSIPQSEFCPLGPRAGDAHLFGLSRFNSSVGILSVGTYALLFRGEATSPVSIPQSEFCPLGPGNCIS